MQSCFREVQCWESTTSTGRPFSVQVAIPVDSLAEADVRQLTRKALPDSRNFRISGCRLARVPRFRVIWRSLKRTVAFRYCRLHSESDLRHSRSRLRLRSIETPKRPRIHTLEEIVTSFKLVKIGIVRCDSASNVPLTVDDHAEELTCSRGIEPD